MFVGSRNSSFIRAQYEWAQCFFVVVVYDAVGQLLFIASQIVPVGGFGDESYGAIPSIACKLHAPHIMAEHFMLKSSEKKRTQVPTST